MTESAELEVDTFNPGWRLLAAFTSFAIVNLACAIDATSVSVALPTISDALHGTAIQAFWIGTAFLLATTVWQPTFIAFSHVFGRRPILLIALTLFTIGAIMCGVSKNITVMLVGRVIQGSGCGGILTLTEALITDLIPLRQRGNYFALIGVVWAFGSVSGPLVGGIFYLNIPIVVIGFVGIIAFLNLSARERTMTEKISQIDYIGAFVFVASSTSFLVPISWGGVMYPWSSWHTLVPLLLGLVGLGAFCIHEAYFALFPLLPIRIFGNRSTSLTYLITFLHGMILWSIVYYLPLYFMGVKGYTPIIAGLGSLPQTLTVVPCAIIVGLVASRTARYRWSLYSGFVLTVLGIGLLYLLDVKTKVVEWVFLLLISGIGMGLLFPGMNLSIQASVSQVDAADAAGLFTFFRTLGQSVGVAIGGVIFQNRMNAELRDYPDLAGDSADVISLIKQMRSLPQGDPLTLILRYAFAKSIKIVFVVMCGLAVLALFATVFIKGYNLNQALATEQGFVDGGRGPLEKDVDSAGPAEDGSKASV
ncbi:MFS multidrug transporter [Hyaloscypha variabilis F]|uniref:MFS multidrug transporter n=1 Tax=Hyaloscypha variabilis (strain UAMH 11265 / GT02V1 / F) TaxID=1149755 RepID=A0A2J6QWN7_HYAVF|nr:MFS multidrug transporter [Hyaloscypha variabilis F]